MNNNNLAKYSSAAFKHILKNGIVGICDAAVKEKMFEHYLEIYSIE